MTLGKDKWVWSCEKNPLPKSKAGLVHLSCGAKLPTVN